MAHKVDIVRKPATSESANFLVMGGGVAKDTDQLDAEFNLRVELVVLNSDQELVIVRGEQH
jgi:hypothetical protein